MCDKANSSTHSSTNLGRSYDVSHLGILNQSEEAKSLLTGSCYFSVVEWEVFLLQ